MCLAVKSPVPEKKERKNKVKKGRRGEGEG
jgi:hypothetical protein